MIVKQEIDIKKENSLSENSSSRILSTPLLNNSTVWIHSLDWSLRLSREADKPKNVTNITINNSPPPGDEAESNESCNFESSKPPLIVPNTPKKAYPFGSNRILSQNNESTALSVSSLIINQCKVRRKYSKISELITDEQKQIIETYYLVDIDIMNKYAEEVRNNITVRDKNNIECNLCPAKYSRLDKCEVNYIYMMSENLYILFSTYVCFVNFIFTIRNTHVSHIFVRSF